MRIGVISDTHSRLDTVRRVAEILMEERVELVLHCGDIEDARVIRLLGDLPTHYVLGNCDSDTRELAEAIAEVGATLQRPFGDMELAGKKLAWIHGHDRSLMSDLETSGAFDYLFYGHTHTAEQHKTGPTLVVNPGALHRARPKSFLLLDPASGEMETRIVE